MFSAVGIKIVAHYCGGELEKIALFSKPTSCCGGEEDSEMAEDDGCCQNDSKHVVTDLFIIPNQQEYLSLTQIPLSVFLINKKDHPPNWVQDDIVSTSNLRI